MINEVKSRFRPVRRHYWLNLALVLVALWFWRYTVATFLIVLCLAVLFLCAPVLLIRPASPNTFTTIDQMAFYATVLLVYYALLLFIPRLSGAARGTQRRKRAWKVALIVYASVNILSVAIALLLYWIGETY